MTTQPNDLLQMARNHLAQMDAHMRSRYTSRLLAESLAELERLRTQLHEICERGERLSLAAAAELERLQARIDRLMLEYCPDEMTPEQIAEWERHQRAVPNALGNRRAAFGASSTASR